MRPLPHGMAVVLAWGNLIAKGAQKTQENQARIRLIFY